MLNEDSFKHVFEAYKQLSDDLPLAVQLTPTQRQNIYNTFASKPTTAEYSEIIAMQIASGTNVNTNLDDTQIKYIAENIDYYANYGELLLNNLSWNIPALTQVLKYMSENNLGVSLTLENILPKFIEIKNRLGITESVFLEQLNDWEDHKSSINSSNIQQVISQPQFFQFSKETKNALTDYLNNTVVEALASIQTEQLFQFKQKQPNNYWIIVLNNLIDTDFLKTLPDNLTDLGKRCLDDIAASRLPIPNTEDLFYKIIEKLDGRKTKETIIKIKNQICNSTQGYNIDKNKFIFLHDWLKKQGDLISRAGDVAQYILGPISTDDTCLNLLTDNSEFYIKIVNAAGEQANTFKNNIRTKLQNNSDERIATFANKIGVELEKKVEK